MNPETIKTCPCCGQKWAAEQWRYRWLQQRARVQFVRAGVDRKLEPAMMLQYVECVCGSTITIDIYEDQLPKEIRNEQQ